MAAEQEMVEHIASQRLTMGSKFLADANYQDARTAFASVLALGESPRKEIVDEAKRGLAEADKFQSMTPEDLAGHSVYAAKLDVETVLTKVLKTQGTDQTFRPERPPVSPVLGPLAPSPPHSARKSPAPVTPEPEPEQPPVTPPRRARQPEPFDVAFAGAGPIGLRFQARGDRQPVTVSEVVPGSQAAQAGRLEVGLVLVAVQRVSVEGETFKTVMQLLAQGERPFVLTFRAEPPAQEQAEAAEPECTPDQREGRRRSLGGTLRRTTSPCETPGKRGAVYLQPETSPMLQRYGEEDEEEDDLAGLPQPTGWALVRATYVGSRTTLTRHAVSAQRPSQ